MCTHSDQQSSLIEHEYIPAPVTWKRRQLLVMTSIDNLIYFLYQIIYFLHQIIYFLHLVIYSWHLVIYFLCQATYFLHLVIYFLYHVLYLHASSEVSKCKVCVQLRYFLKELLDTLEQKYHVHTMLCSSWKDVRQLNYFLKGLCAQHNLLPGRNLLKTRNFLKDSINTINRLQSK